MSAADRTVAPAPYTLADAQARAVKDRDAWWTVLLVDPVATRLSVVVANRTPLTPNAITLVSFGIGVLAAAAFWNGSRTTLVVGALLYHAAFITDCIDGKVARLTGSGTRFGMALDYVADRIRVIVVAAALFLGLERSTGESVYLVLGAVVIGLDLLRYLDNLGQRAILSATGARATPPTRDSLRARLAAKRIRPHLFSGVEFQMAVFIVGPIVGSVKEVTVVAAILLLIFEVIVLARLAVLVQRARA